ncbi:hypothetical protein BaRGS_00021891 [Batillaria attramentaria]|uniref:Uncharacterized protein n=1 Tax=Batillaria attramentaria TaxID=370345 RepID=A0ABD0KIQ8_9CAEN
MRCCRLQTKSPRLSGTDLNSSDTSCFRLKRVLVKHGPPKSEVSLAGAEFEPPIQHSALHGRHSALPKGGGRERGEDKHTTHVEKNQLGKGENEWNLKQGDVNSHLKAGPTPDVFPTPPLPVSGKQFEFPSQQLIMGQTEELANAAQR